MSEPKKDNKGIVGDSAPMDRLKPEKKDKQTQNPKPNEVRKNK